MPKQFDVYEIINVAGGLVADYFLKPDYEQQKRQIDAYYTKYKAIVEKNQNQMQMQNLPIIPGQIGQPTQNISDEIKEGTACLTCSKDHLLTVSGALKEAIRFARRPDKGLRCFEVRERVATAEEELNIMERLDLVPAKIEKLSVREKKLAIWIANQSSQLRHMLTAIQTNADLENVSSMVSKINSEIMKNMWDIQTVTGTVDALCLKIEDEVERKKCMENINAALHEKVNP